MEVTCALWVNCADSDAVTEDGELADWVHPSLNFFRELKPVDFVSKPVEDTEEYEREEWRGCEHTEPKKDILWVWTCCLGYRTEWEWIDFLFADSNVVGDHWDHKEQRDFDPEEDVETDSADLIL